MEYTIKFTLAGSDKWLTTSDACEIWSEAQMEERILYIIGTRLKIRAINGIPQKVKLFSKEDKLIGEASDILEHFSLKLYLDKYPS